MKKEMADKMLASKGPQEGTRSWLRLQLAKQRGHAERDEDEDEKRKERKALLKKLRERGQGEHVEDSTPAFKLPSM